MVDVRLREQYPEVECLRYLFLDLNAYFASVEQQEHPELRNKPIAVVPVDADSSFVIAASYEAKAYGIKTGTRIGQAKEMCPDLLCVRSTPYVYTHYHRLVIQAVESVVPVEKVCSIDEMQCRLIGEECEPENVVKIAARVKEALNDQVGPYLRASIGIAPNPFLAKVATDMMKPNGLVVLDHTVLPDALFRLRLTDLTGINIRTERRLNAAGIFSVEELYKASSPELHRAFGSIVGRHWWYKLRGIHLREQTEPQKSLGNSHVMAPELRTDEGARSVLIRILQKASARLRADNLKTSSMHVGVTGRPGWQAHARFAATHDAVLLGEHFASMWKSRTFRSPLKVAITFTDLAPAVDCTPSLFDDERSMEHLSETLDEINQKFGKNSVFVASLGQAKHAAPERIAFQKVDLFKEGKGDHEYPEGLNTFRGLASY